MRLRASAAVFLWVALSAVIPASAETGDDEARITIDVKDADIADLVRLLAEVGGLQVVMDPGVSCKLTLRLTEVRWPAVLDVALRSCRLGREEEGGILRVARVGRLAEEAAARRKLEEERRLAAPPAILRQRLSYARAQELAPILKKLLSPRGEVIYDSRTNTLIIID